MFLQRGQGASWSLEDMFWNLIFCTANEVLFLIAYKKWPHLTLYPIETPFDAFANRADTDQTALVVVIICNEKSVLAILAYFT